MDAVMWVEVAAAGCGVIAGVIAGIKHTSRVFHRGASRLSAIVDEHVERAAIKISEPIVIGLDRNERVLSAHIEDCKQDRATQHWRMTGIERELAFVRGKAEGVAETSQLSQVEAHVHLDGPSH